MEKITRVERKILANQYSILEKVDPDRADDYAVLREVLENGFEADYDGVLRDVYNGSDIMSVEDCKYVGDVLHMFDMMQTSFRNGETAAVDPAGLRFWGFDGNNEGKFMTYAQHMRKNGKWTFIELASEDFNSHCPTREKYGQMLADFNASRDKHRLTAADIVRILG
jgi:hypothetical protein